MHCILFDRDVNTIRYSMHTKQTMEIPQRHTLEYTSSKDSVAFVVARGGATEGRPTLEPGIALIIDSFEL